MFTIYGIKNCDTVKKALNFLDNKKIKYTFVDFKKTPPSEVDIKRWQKSFGGLPVNKSGPTYRKYKEEFESLSEARQIQFIQTQTSMIKRPILEHKGKTLCFGFDPERYSELVADYVKDIQYLLLYLTYITLLNAFCYDLLMALPKFKDASILMMKLKSIKSLHIKTSNTIRNLKNYFQMDKVMITNFYLT